MINKLKSWIASHEALFVPFLVLVFILIRLPATNFPLHQDEYKWPIIVNPANQSDVSIPHPPLGEFIYRTAGYIVGFNTHFRFVPLFFGTLNLLLLYYFVKTFFGKKEAVISALIWIFSYFSVLASLMVDTDGEIMPFFFLLALIGYFKSKEVFDKEKYKWFVLLALACVFGFLIKVSFLLAIFAIIADFLWSKRNNLSKKDVLRYIVRIGFVCIGFIIVLFLSQKLFPFFSLSKSVTYWEHFWTSDRDWFQTAIQCAKALLYTSPILILLPFFGTKEIFSKTKVFIFFILGAIFFYVILFDFSIGALDRYFQFIILPLSVIGGITIAEVFKNKDFRIRECFIVGVIISFFIILLQFLPHYVPPLHPKSEWISRALHLKWNFLYPFSGGSGPLGFYVSFLFMAIIWIISIFVAFVSIWKPRIKVLCLCFIITLGFAYNLVFTEEYLFGFANGSATRLLSQAVEYIKNNQDIQKVTVYNDNGGNEIREIGKYRKRLYVDPKFNVDNTKLIALNQYKEHYFVLDIPRLDPTSIYQKYLNSCNIVYNQKDKYISAIVYDCRGIKDVK